MHIPKCHLCIEAFNQCYIFLGCPPPLTVSILVSLHSWATGDWGACSRSCGGGQQTRSLRCLRKVTYQREEVVAHSLCPVISPAQVQPCHTQACPPEWSTGSWSQVGLWQHLKMQGTWLKRMRNISTVYLLDGSAQNWVQIFTFLRWWILVWFSYDFSFCAITSWTFVAISEMSWQLLYGFW